MTSAFPLPGHLKTEVQLSEVFPLLHRYTYYV